MLETVRGFQSSLFRLLVMIEIKSAVFRWLFECHFLHPQLQISLRAGITATKALKDWNVGSGEKQEACRGVTISTRPTYFLTIPLQCLGHIEMDDL